MGINIEIMEQEKSYQLKNGENLIDTTSSTFNKMKPEFGRQGTSELLANAKLENGNAMITETLDSENCVIRNDQIENTDIDLEMTYLSVSDHLDESNISEINEPNFENVHNLTNGNNKEYGETTDELYGNCQGDFVTESLNSSSFNKMDSSTNKISPTFKAANPASLPWRSRKMRYTKQYLLNLRYAPLCTKLPDCLKKFQLTGEIPLRELNIEEAKNQHIKPVENLHNCRSMDHILFYASLPYKRTRSILGSRTRTRPFTLYY